MGTSIRDRSPLDPTKGHPDPMQGRRAPMPGPITSRRRGLQDIDPSGATLRRGDLDLRICRPVAASAFACHREDDLLDDRLRFAPPDAVRKSAAMAELVDALA